MTQQKKLTREEVSWILYDCGNSAYSMAITTALLPIYFGMFKPGDGMDLGYFNSLASLLIAVLSPVLGTIADFRGRKKQLFTIFSLLGIVGTAALAGVPYGAWQLLIFIFILADLGFAGSNIFYDSFLVDVTDDTRMDRISAMGFAYGYIASVLPFGLCLAVVWLLGMQSYLGYQVSFLLTAGWWLAFTLPMYRNVRQRYAVDPVPHPVRESFVRIGKTLRAIRSYRPVVLFLLAYFLYIDGVDTIIKMVVPYTQTVLGGKTLDMFLLLGILLVIQIIAFPCALLYGRLADQFGTKRMIQVAIITYIIAVFFAYTIDSVGQIFILGAMVGSAQGGIQALSRSHFAKIVPKEQASEFFGFYNIFGKFAAILGPMIMSLVTDLTGQARFSIFGILPLFVIGFLLTLTWGKETL